MRSAWRALFLTCLPVGAATILLVSFPEAAIGVFSSDARVIALGSTYVLLVGMTQLFMAAEVVILGAFAGDQWTAWPAVIVVSSQLSGCRWRCGWLHEDGGSRRCGLRSHRRLSSKEWFSRRCSVFDTAAERVKG